MMILLVSFLTPLVSGMFSFRQLATGAGVVPAIQLHVLDDFFLLDFKGASRRGGVLFYRSPLQRCCESCLGAVFTRIVCLCGGRHGLTGLSATAWSLRLSTLHARPADVRLPSIFFHDAANITSWEAFSFSVCRSRARMSCSWPNSAGQFKRDFLSLGRVMDGLRMIQCRLQRVSPFLCSRAQSADELRNKIKTAFFLLLAISVTSAWAAFSSPISCFSTSSARHIRRIPYFKPMVWSSFSFTAICYVRAALCLNDHTTPAIGIGSALLMNSARCDFFSRAMETMAAVWTRFLAEGLIFLLFLPIGFYGPHLSPAT